MGYVDAARIEVAALLQNAGGYDGLAELIGTATANRGPAFDGATAGRAHAAHGDAVRLALEDLSHPIREWARAAHEIASALRVSADRYVAADVSAAHRLG